MSSRFFVGAAALAIILAVGQASAAAQDQSFKAAGKPQKGGTGKLAIPVQPTPLGATVESVLAVGRQLNPALRAAALDTSAAAAKATGADALDDPIISDSYLLKSRLQEWFRLPEPRPPQAGYWCSRGERRPNVRLIWRGNDQAVQSGSDLGYRNSRWSIIHARINLIP